MEVTTVKAREASIPPVTKVAAAVPVSSGAYTREQAREDRIELSRQAVEAMKEALDKKAREKKEKGGAKSDMQQQLDNAKQAAEAKMEETKMKLRCLQIALSIMNGDNVPPEDEKYLMDHDPELHFRAIMMRRLKEDPEEKESVLEDEEQKEEGGADPAAPAPAPATESAAATEAPPAPAEAPPAEGG